jgi:hypothetical protein
MEAFMLMRLTLAAAATALALPVLAQDDCLADRTGAQCDMFMDEYRAAETPVGTTHVWSTQPFVIENFRYLDASRPSETPRGQDLLYWDGESAMIVTEEAGPQVKIADW